MATVFEHPVFPDQKQVVENDEDVKSWLDSGWIKSKDRSFEPPSKLTSAEEWLRDHDSGTPVVESTGGGFLPNTEPVKEN